MLTECVVVRVLGTTAFHPFQTRTNRYKSQFERKHVKCKTNCNVIKFLVLRLHTTNLRALYAWSVLERSNKMVQFYKVS